jgi:nucleotide-binding universal stress UspA family protein
MAGSHAQTIVVGYDGSKHAERALQWAVDEAILRHARLRVVHAWLPPFVEGFPYTGAAHEPEAMEAAGRELLDGAVQSALTGVEQPPFVERVVVCGSPASTLLERSKDADLVVVGSRGLGGFRGLLLGSVSHQVVHHASCPVVVVHDQPDAQP